MGGAIVADKAWFYGAARFQENAFYLAGNYDNLNAGDPTQWTYAPDFSRQAEDWITQQAGNGRVTWQASQNHRLSFHYEQQSRDIWSGNALIAPESTGNFMFPKNNFATVGWTAPLSSRLCWKCEARTARKRSSSPVQARRRSGMSRGRGKGPLLTL